MLLKTHFNRIWFAFQLFSETLLHYNNKVKSVADDCHSTLTSQLMHQVSKLYYISVLLCIKMDGHQWMCKKY